MKCIASRRDIKYELRKIKYFKVLTVHRTKCILISVFMFLFKENQVYIVLLELNAAYCLYVTEICSEIKI